MPAAAALLFVYVAVRLFWEIGSKGWPILDAAWVELGLLKILLWVVPSILVIGIAARRAQSSLFEWMGFRGSPAKGLAFGLAASLPMAVVVLASGSLSWSADSVIASGILGPFAEEVLFRGFLFLSLLRAGWRPATAIVASALVFGFAHSQWTASIVAVGSASLLFSSDASWIAPEYVRALTALMPFVAGGILLAWIVRRFGSIWPAVGFHAFVNLWWDLSASPLEMASVAKTSLTPLPIAHALAAVAAIVLTLWMTPDRKVRRRSDGSRIFGPGSKIAGPEDPTSFRWRPGL